ncbi:tyrosine-protein kinase family protein [Candidatus Magnetaquicoccus inordinatus]|uniref:tyrosine-protein kinase family protein n=1 Tax=Candidatus Magnetaquicoccus inordinatus TaxID=2496818 RepID=UPI00102B14C1|nr:ParA family protein [Candidatus Magnetaquicoccus inordinatus]
MIENLAKHRPYNSIFSAEILLSWVDLSRLLWKVTSPSIKSNYSQPPVGLIYAQTFWDCILIGINTDSSATIKRDASEWFKEIVGEHRWNETQEDCFIQFNLSETDLSRLQVQWELLDNAESAKWQETTFRPRFSPSRTILFHAKPAPLPQPFPSDVPPLLVFHSFKGGVGRTLCALSMAQAYSEKKKKVLLIDGDFEAPGISILLRDRKPDFDFSFADLLTLLHADPDPQGQNALKIAEEKIRNLQVGNLFVLPCFRHLEENLALAITPEQLLNSTAHSSFFLTETLAQLGQRLQVDMVLIDLRAGFSELAAPILFDPRVYTLYVANGAGQSLVGTELLIRQLLLQSQWDEQQTRIIPALIFNQIPQTELANIEQKLEPINQTLIHLFSERLSDDERQNPITLNEIEQGVTYTTISYHESLASLSAQWDKAMEAIRQSGIPTKLWNELQQWLPSARHITLPPSNELVTEHSLLEKRKKLAKFADTMITAEKAAYDPQNTIGFLPIKSLKNLAEDHLHKLPIVVSIGAKGAGKTYSFINIVRSINWSNFVNKVDNSFTCSLQTGILPLLWGKNCNITEMVGYQQRCQQALDLPTINTSDEIRQIISEFNSENLFAWRTQWADLIAHSLGISVSSTDSPIEALLTHLREKKQKLIVLIDGLEETFDKFTKNPVQQIALHALIQELPNWLATLPDQPLGIIIFIRQDMVEHAIPQNRNQFVQRHKNHELRWTWDEALELTAWVADRSQATEQLWQDFSELNEADKMERLVPLWGYKMGGEGSKESKSNNWVLSVLSDLHGGIQARDVVRFLHLAAENSIKLKTTDRILAPSAMREAIQSCSNSKIAEISEENDMLKGIFAKIMQNSATNTPNRFITPCSLLELAQIGLDEEEIELLIEHGIIFHDKLVSEYHFPEIFRYGLNIDRAAGARPKIVSLLRKARLQSRA